MDALFHNLIWCEALRSGVRLRASQMCMIYLICLKNL